MSMQENPQPEGGDTEINNSTIWFILSIAGLLGLGIVFGMAMFQNAVLGVLVLAALCPIPIILIAMKNRKDILLDSGSESEPERHDT